LLLLAGALGSVALAAHQAGWLALLAPAPKGETAEEGPPLGEESPADEVDPGDLDLTPRQRASYPDELVALLEVPKQERLGGRAASPDGRWLAVGVGKVVHLWRLGKAVAALKLEGHPGRVTALAFTPDSRTLLAG